MPRLRHDLDFFPSPSPEHPGLFLRDPFRYSDAMLVVPPLLVECLRCFDGRQTDLDLRSALVRLTGDLDTGQVADYFRQSLSQAGFLEDETFAKMRGEKRQAFAARAVRKPAHAGTAYPADPAALRQTLAGWTEAGSAGGLAAGGSSRDGHLAAIAAPHVSPAGGWQSYRAAYGLLRPEHRDRTFVILATSHYGAPQSFGLTRKNFHTPLGEAVTDTASVDWLAKRAANSVEMEDFCHSFEHTIELQLVFLQHALGANVRIVPVLCGPFAHSILGGGKPEDDDKVKAFCDALGELQDREGDRLLWVLGVDMAHMGARYADRFRARAGEGKMQEVRQRDAERIARINAADAAGFWDLVQQNRDDLKWCGSSPFYAFLKSVPGLRGELLHYEQWNIDEQSVVSFAGMAFGR
ncbi:MAG: AmmeMemoRadiSam system protein B [Bryobacteraceae bacterium]